ncbi:MAG: hypothetical protein UY31_C0011G0003 [Candidatus Wolfebacteria bacterium GW2011_GWE1_48_7]|nr:MAG: hypothetical protein UX70_C0001G1057 [Candidatus Wolfebacteria bacterium GW2011_GWB1_47_1]KKU35163.1 MAG: hypothetical protein UX49_C0029G0004 [Candidatus Wolfebacteria bacterium GW2011_GWC2_46_275]KKU53468.1 MAG: hypothetical protein UX76_C0015G0009 [Candidatus Wolfebacteria bacterium GW2011_GWC1_47_103]KKU71232.1 MAG: hypothetical protein UX96_C0025G0009 [Candidatus Wolfebacteria bacterium GW2011_GWB1_47_243]KKW00064.1 MAG: hypothetical protein UY31_C0011G0003 [Candidatus Wolfebacteri
MKDKACRAGVSLIEVIIVMGIFVVLAAAVRFFPIEYFYAQSLEDDASKIVFTLRGAYNRAVTQDQASAWGVRFVNGASGVDYYQVFKGDSFATGTVVERINLNESIQFTTPPAASSTDVLFAKMSGLPTGGGSIIISVITEASSSKMITVLPNGQIQY